jgi:hypothetical protein
VAVAGAFVLDLHGSSLGKGRPMTRRDVSLLLLAAAVIFALLLIARGTPQAASCRRDGCFVHEAETIWRDLERVDSV